MLIFLFSLLVVILGGLFVKLSTSLKKSSSTADSKKTQNSDKNDTPQITTNKRESSDESFLVNKEEFQKVFKNVSSNFFKNISEQISKNKEVLNLMHNSAKMPSMKELISTIKGKSESNVVILAEEEQALTEIGDDEETVDIATTPIMSDDEEDEEDFRKSISTPIAQDDSPPSQETVLNKMNEKRKNILAEILSTEEYYVKGLLILDFVYKKQIEQKKIVDPKVLKTIFQDVDLVLNVNQQFLTELRKIYEKERNLERSLQDRKNNFSSLGELLNSYAHSFKLYSTYIAGYKKASAALSEEKKKNKKLTQFLDGLKQLLKDQGERITQLESYLVTPVQRIPRYRLLLEDLYKNTPNDDTAKGRLEEALELIKKIALYVNDAEVKVENIQVTSHMVHKLKLKGFIKPSRYLINYWAEENDSPIQCRANTSSKINNCELYIFSDIIVLHKRFDSFLTSKIELLLTRKGTKQSSKLIVKEVQINNGSKNGTNDLDINIKWIYENNSTKQLTFIAKSADDLKKLESSIRTAINGSSTNSISLFKK
ncbi:rhoGEF domain-containing protein [Naegleria gruberi]|uniref:RhoGEF domain-containing protein n=1 Tax=Naegleria gruberi TaxID=5762 RepID=D2VHG2_NAEGR|nr:rhoGEF domain-containing protein [Naegleria gruberi]EFC43582.1 rhoGEF domain-containing protein [Naegleria gruberi]|eukprot:XP_002676326.1 rhoGEF domain-containing protein [Naegleria gruberi strain NEG-M]